VERPALVPAALVLPPPGSECFASGRQIESVTFFVDGRKARTVFAPDESGRFTFTMSCSRLGFSTTAPGPPSPR
jgi:hypothetical protein